MRPVAPTRAAAGLVVVCVPLLVIARTTGSGWIMVILSAVAGLLLAGAVLPGVALARAELTLRVPRDATVGAALPVDVAVERGPAARLRPLDPPGPDRYLPGPARGRLELVPERRGVHRRVSVELRTAAPVGLVWWTRRLRLDLAVPLEVAPAPLPGTAPTDDGRDSTGERLHPTAGTDLVRSVRAYVPGDPTRLVSWTATARAGELMVKELEGPIHPVLAVLVDLSAPPPMCEQAASEAAGLIEWALARGIPVLLSTVEAGGLVLGPVASTVAAGRRLARAVPGRPAAGPLPAGARVIRLGAA